MDALRDEVEKFLYEHYRGRKEIVVPLIELYRDYNALDIKDRKFDRDFTDGRPEHFYGYLWEMLLARHLNKLGHALTSEDEGPDFLLEIDNRRVWIEATCPSPEGIPEHWLSPPDIREPARVTELPHQEIILRWTSAISGKKFKLDGFRADRHTCDGYLQKGIVRNNESYVIAISSCQLGFLSTLLVNGISELPFAVEAVFPVGPIEVQLNRATGEVTNSGPGFRNVIIKPKNGAKVPTDNFLNSSYEYVSAIIGSNAGLNAACGDKASYIVVHNPLARNPAPMGCWGADQEFVAIDKGDHYELRDILIPPI